MTQEFAVQVSDRCQSDLNTGEAIEQEANKAVFLSNRVSFAFTGLAVIEGKPADVWLRDVLVPHESIGHAVQLIVDEATRAFGEMPGSPAAKRQAFVGAGWALFPNLSDALLPFGVTITNALTDDGWLPGVLDEFAGDVRILSDGGPYLWTDVGGLPANRKAKLNRSIRNQVDRGLSATTLAELLVREVRAMADRNTRIGRGLMVSSIPKAVTETHDFLALSSMPTDTEVTFAHLRHDDSIETTEGPHVVRPGGTVFSNFKHINHGDGGETVSVDIRAS